MFPTNGTRTTKISCAFRFFQKRSGGVSCETPYFCTCACQTLPQQSPFHPLAGNSLFIHGVPTVLSRSNQLVHRILFVLSRGSQLIHGTFSILSQSNQIHSPDIVHSFSTTIHMNRFFPSLHPHRALPVRHIGEGGHLLSIHLHHLRRQTREPHRSRHH